MYRYCYCRRPDPFYQTLKAGQAVFFGCDVGQFSEGSSGIMDTELFEYEVGPLSWLSFWKKTNRFQECFRHLAFSFKGRPFAHQ
jgi:aminopeptidase C